MDCTLQFDSFVGLYWGCVVHVSHLLVLLSIIGLVHGWSINLLGGGSSFARQQGFFLNLGRWLWS